MQNSVNDNLIAKILALGTAFTTIFIVSGSVTDPVNTPKLLALGVFSTSAFGVFILSRPSAILRRNLSLFISLLLFFIFMLNAVISSDSPVSQNLYGVYGRNNGMFTYIFLILALISTLSLNSKKGFHLLVKSLLVAGMINIIYCLWVIAFGDFIGWSNPYGNILGTLGNPNFIGSFLGIFFSALLAYGLSPTVSMGIRYSLLIILPLTLFEIIKSHAIQGLVVAALGSGIVGFFYVRSKFQSAFSFLYAVLFGILGTVALLGALQIGPLAKFIYKTSVSLRGQYWLAAWNTGEVHPFTGVGMDAFGDWYRQSRDSHALELPGVNTVVNAAHNVPLDMFAFGGWPLFIAYISIMAGAMLAIVRFMLREKAYDPVFVALFTAWAGYQIQSIISINQIGLAVWGWVLTGALIAYEFHTRPTPELLNTQKNKTLRMNQRTQFQSISMLTGALGGIIGLLVALPPFSADSKWRAAQSTRTDLAIVDSMKPSLFNPMNSMKYMNNIISLSQAQLFDLAHQYAVEATRWNSESFELWRVLYFMENSTEEERALALENMKRLDPLNPNVLEIP